MHLDENIIYISKWIFQKHHKINRKLVFSYISHMKYCENISRGESEKGLRASLLIYT